ncbi:MAG TPA: TetR/AcrR family transcriptional regulator [Acidimicrobiales bacterium]
MSAPAPTTRPGGRSLAGARARALPPEQRRAAIATAALGLLLEHGTAVTSRQIAEAAGVAEGTIFRAFPDKDAVIAAAVDLALDPAPAERALGGIDPSLPLEDQLVVAVEIIQRRMADIGRLVSAIGGPAVFAGRQRPLPHMEALVTLFTPWAHALRFDPERAARLLPALTLAFSHPVLFGDEPMDAPQIVSLLLDGIRCRPEARATGRHRSSPC